MRLRDLLPAAVLITLPVAAIAWEIALALPAGCVLETPAAQPQMQSCDFENAAGDSRRITVEVVITSDPSLPAMGAGASVYLSWLLIEVLNGAGATAPGPGDRLLLSQVATVAPEDMPAGVDACATYDYDYATDRDGGTFRGNDRGMWCLSNPPGEDTLRVVKIEYLAVTPGSDNRPPGFQAEADQLIGSFAIDW